MVANGEVLSTTDGFPALRVDLPPGFSRAQGHQLLVRDVREEGRDLVVQLAADTRGIREPLDAYLRALAVTVPLMIGIAALSAGAVASRLLAPLKALERSAREIAAGGGARLRTPIPGTDKADELGSLARTLQDSFDRLAAARERERDFTRAAAHDLRSPLTALRTRLQATLARERDAPEYARQLRELEVDVARMSELAEHLLMLARDADEALTLAPLDLSALARERVARARTSHPGMDIETRGHAEVGVEGDARLLAHVLDNLIDNAARHGAGSPVTVTVRRVGGSAWLAVRDEGPGVDPAELPRLTRPFHQADAARSSGGSGLGLAIVARIAELHGADLRLANALPAGFEASLRLPLAAPGPAAG